jgi:hypothetical protein
MADNSARFFANSDLLVNAMGRWPSFHDAKLKSVLRGGDFCRALLHVFQMTDKVDSKGYSVLTKHHLVTIEMSGIKECTLPENYDGDVLFGLSAESEGALVKVRPSMVQRGRIGLRPLCTELGDVARSSYLLAHSGVFVVSRMEIRLISTLGEISAFGRKQT